MELMISIKSLTIGIFVCLTLSATVFGFCGYSGCPKTKPGVINVHLVAHSHDDVGWLKTVDQYYYGSHTKIQHASVQYTLDSVIEELQKDSRRRFIYAETAFFWRWWLLQDEGTRNIVTNLVNNGQFEFISGGWAMNDEACPHYSAIIDQMTLGLRFLNQTFGKCAVPKVGWQIDPFGHSREQAFLFAQMGFDGLFIGRLDYNDRSNRKIHHDLEMIWRGNSKDLGRNSSSLFTGVLYNYYQPPEGFCFDILCDDDPIIDDPKLSSYNVKEKVKQFVNIAKWWSAPYETQHLLLTMGSDFHYMAAHTWYKNLDKLIKYANQVTNSTKVHLLYSTPMCYLQEVHKTQKELSTKTDDFFPYSNDPHGFWSAFNGKPSEYVLKQLFQLEEPVAVVQHHDAITGTAKQHVVDDYSLRLWVGVANGDAILSEAFLRSQPMLNQTRSRHTSSPYQFCHGLNISACNASENMRDFLLTIYNPLVKNIKDAYIRVPVTRPTYKVYTARGMIPSQIVEIPKSVLLIPGRQSSALYELVFHAELLEGLTFTNFRIKDDGVDSSANFSAAEDKMTQNQTGQKAEVADDEFIKEDDLAIKNSKGLEIVIDGTSGLLKAVRRGRAEMPIKQNFYFYEGMSGNNSKFEWRASGVYIFRPNTTAADRHMPKPVAARVRSYKVHQEGVHVTEVHQVFTDWLTQVIRLYDKSEMVEFEWLIGPIPIEDDIGKEIVTKYTTDLPTNGVFFTDSNGRQLVKRKRNFRETYAYKNYEPVAGNYYPVPSRILISGNEDLSQNGKTLIILNDRSQGGSSMRDGEIELMLHRRLLHDDAFGVGEALNETAFGEGIVTRGKHWLLFAGEGTGVPVASHRDAALEIYMDKVLGFVDASFLLNSITPDHSSNNPVILDSSHQPSHLLSLLPQRTIISSLARILPPRIHLLTVEPVSSFQFLLRLEHFYEADEHPVHSSPVRISFKEIMQALPFIKSLKETTLGGNQWVEDAKRLEWATKGARRSEDESANDPVTKSQDFCMLYPMDIKTFLVTT